MLGRVKPAVVVGFGGYPTVPPLYGRDPARHPDRAARAERRHGPRQPPAGVAGHSDRHGLSHAQEPRIAHCKGKMTFTGNPVRREVIAAAAHRLCCAGCGRYTAPRGVRRQPGRASDGRDRAGGDRAARRRLARCGLASCSRRARRTSMPCARLMRGSASPPNARRSLPICRRAWPPPIWSSPAPAPPPWPSSPPSAGRPSWCRCRIRSIRTSSSMPALLARGRRRHPYRAARLHPATPGRRDRDLAGDPGRLARMARAAKSAGTIDAAERLADVVLKVAGL